MMRLNLIFKYLFIFTLLGIPGMLLAKPFVVGNLMGQLGNQMFIIAATTSLALDHGAVPLFPDFLHPPKADIDKLAYNHKMLFYHLNTKKPKKKVAFTYSEPHFHYSPIPYRKNMSLSGYFQSEKYFIKHKQEILKLFAPHPEIMTYLLTKYSDIIKHSNTVSIHYRSYMNYDPTQQYHPTLGVEYFEKAIECFPEDTLFVVFSNTIDQCKRIFAHIPRNFRYIEGETHIHDLYLMSMCKNQIISNSSFSWWAAYLNQNPDKIVIAPPRWFGPKYDQHNTKDLLPSEWVVLSY